MVPRKLRSGRPSITSATPEEPIVVGRPLANTQIYILDAHGQPVPIGVPGEIHIAGDGVTCGYLNRPELTAEKFVRDPFSANPNAKMYRTGDLGRFLPDGRIEFEGRIDNQVKIRGYRIELGEIETVLGQHPAVQECVVIAREDVPGDKRLVGYVVPAAGQSPSVTDLRSWVKERVPEYMTPVAFVTLERFPLSPNGKVDRKHLPAPDYVRPDLGRAYFEARTPAEEVIAGIWAEVLKLDQVGIEDDFFELGGHSLLGNAGGLAHPPGVPSGAAAAVDVRSFDGRWPRRTHRGTAAPETGTSYPAHDTGLARQASAAFVRAAALVVPRPTGTEQSAL